MTTAILLSTFLISIVALLFFIVAVTRGWFDSDSRGARVIFARNEIGKPRRPGGRPRSAQGAAGLVVAAIAVLISWAALRVRSTDEAAA